MLVRLSVLCNIQASDYAQVGCPCESATSLALSPRFTISRWYSMVTLWRIEGGYASKPVKRRENDDTGTTSLLSFSGGKPCSRWVQVNDVVCNLLLVDGTQGSPRDEWEGTHSNRFNKAWTTILLWRSFSPLISSSFSSEMGPGWVTHIRLVERLWILTLSSDPSAPTILATSNSNYK